MSIAHLKCYARINALNHSIDQEKTKKIQEKKAMVKKERKKTRSRPRKKEEITMTVKKIRSPARERSRKKGF